MSTDLVDRYQGFYIYRWPQTSEAKGWDATIRKSSRSKGHIRGRLKSASQCFWRLDERATRELNKQISKAEAELAEI